MNINFSPTSPLSADGSDLPLALEMHTVSHSYGDRQALDNVSLHLSSGEMMAIVGPNGAGKTTFFNLATGFFYPQNGAVRIFGYDMARSATRALAMLGAVFQQRAVDMGMTLRQNLLYHAALHGIGRREAEARIITEAERLGIADKLPRRAAEVSGGELRRMEIARALLHRPALLLLDEPSVGLDALSRAAIMEHLRSLTQHKICAVCFATHLFDEVMNDDRVALLHHGKLLSCGRLGDLLAAEQKDSLQELFFSLHMRAA
ncbi:MAG: ATP-binding cassette domain-containing protein [Gammaproteobacteria bacterium]